MIHFSNWEPLSPDDTIPFQCRLCSGCCRYVADKIMLEPLDAYNLAQYLRKQGEPVMGTVDVLASYAHAAWMEDALPAFFLNTVGNLETCVFLKAGRCSIYEARPRICRLYPLTIGMNGSSRDFYYFLCTDKNHHFANGSIPVQDWLSQNLSEEDRLVLWANYDALTILQRNAWDMEDEQFKQLSFKFIYYYYYNYNLDEPFLPQFLSNLEKLKELTSVDSCLEFAQDKEWIPIDCEGE